MANITSVIEESKSTQEVIESALVELGLNRYEARVYLALISEGVATAKTLSNITSIPYGKVYEVIDSLVGKGFALTLPTKPVKCRAVPPKESLERVKQKTQEKFEKVSQV